MRHGSTSGNPFCAFSGTNSQRGRMSSSGCDPDQVYLQQSTNHRNNVSSSGSQCNAAVQSPPVGNQTTAVGAIDAVTQFLSHIKHIFALPRNKKPERVFNKPFNAKPTSLKRWSENFINLIPFSTSTSSTTAAFRPFQCDVQSPASHT